MTEQLLGLPHDGRRYELVAGEDDTLEGGAVVPGFRCRVGEIFAT